MEFSVKWCMSLWRKLTAHFVLNYKVKELIRSSFQPICNTRWNFRIFRLWILSRWKTWERRCTMRTCFQGMQNIDSWSIFRSLFDINGFAQLFCKLIRNDDIQNKITEKYFIKISQFFFILWMLRRHYFLFSLFEKLHFVFQIIFT